MNIIFYASRMMAILIMLLLATSFLLIIFASEQYLPKLISPCSRGEQDQGGVEIGEGIAPAWTWQFSVPVTVSVEEGEGKPITTDTEEGEGKVKVGDPWASNAADIFSMNILGCVLPNVQVASLTSNATDYNIVCAFLPNAATVTSPQWVLVNTNFEYGYGRHYPIVEITWANLDTSRVYRYLMTWRRGIVVTHAENAISRIRVEQEVLPQWQNMTLYTFGVTCAPGTSVVVRGPGGTINTFTHGTTISRVNSTHILLRLTVVFTAATQVQQIEWVRTQRHPDFNLPCDRWLGGHLVMRVTFIDSSGNVRTINAAPNDTFVFEKYIILRQR